MVEMNDQKIMGVNDFSLLVPSLKILDPILQFLTKATGNPLISLQQLQGTVAGGSQTNSPAVLEQIPELARRGILQLVVVGATKEDDDEKDIFSLDPATVKIGFPLANSSSKGSLSGSTKAAAKKRMAALVRSLRQQTKGNEEEICHESKPVGTLFESSHSPTDTDTNKPHEPEDPDEDENQQALQQLSRLLNLSNQPPPTIEKKHTDSSMFILPGQAKLAGFQQGRTLRTLPLQNYKIPSALTEALSISVEDITNKIIPDNTASTNKQKMLYSHQVEAIESILSGRHTIISTSTGSGKSLCYLLPVLYAAMMADSSNTTATTRSLLIFPTKALAQDQLHKIHSILKKSSVLEQRIKVAIIDGDNTNWSHRATAAEQCHIVITNPDTIHASILPNWKNCYHKLLANIQYIAFDEAHVYQGCFGAHVSYIISRLLRLCSVASCMTMTSDTSMARTTPIFIASSATIDNPEGRFRLLCRIPNHAKVKVLLPSDDGSPWYDLLFVFFSFLLFLFSIH